MTTGLSAIDCLGHPRILVIGDLILDGYTWTEAERISPEAPVMVLRAEREEVRLGGAASVASLLRALEARVTLAGVTGDDTNGRLLRKLLNDEGIAHQAVLCDDGRPTTAKERFMGRAPNRQPQQMFRVDREERRPLNDELERRLTREVLALLSDHEAVLVADYAKGVCTPLLLTKVIAGARQHGIPVFVDPARVNDYSHYRHASLLAPNRVETELATGRRIDSPKDALGAADFLSQRWEIPAVLIKLDQDGMALSCEGRSGRHFPTSPRAVQDVTGAGDMVLAMVGICRTVGTDWDQTVQLANIAAGLEVERFGVAAITREELKAACALPWSPSKCVTEDHLAFLASEYRRQGKTLVFTNGCFDLLHAGHVSYLQEAASLGDVLIVAANSDQSVRRLKGDDRPVIKEADRAAMLAALGCVDHVIIFAEDTPHALLESLRPDILVKGGTYSVDQVVGREVVEAYGGRVAVLSLVEGTSTTTIIRDVMAKQRFLEQAS
jgi:D-beta-D-heptose 7-phosphate kinase/D-beta-D-heptose 1-phosphate adenosyltransferase